LKGGNYHYHHGMAAGDNTLDALITLVLTRSMVKQGSIDTDDFRTSYISFMTTPDTHNDTYAGTCHRMFFKNLQAGIPSINCPDNDSHNVDSLDALMTLPPVVLAHIHSTCDERNLAIKAVIQTTRNTDAVLPYAYIYSDMILALINGKTMQSAAQLAGNAIGFDVAAQVSLHYILYVIVVEAVFAI
jgi:ADP-ribosyl-[dinitrogen reductase] hydrolase